MSTPRPDDALVVSAIADVDHPVKTAAAEWARTTLGLDDMRDRDRDSVFFREAWAACADYGLQASIVPTDDGGGGDFAVDSAPVPPPRECCGVAAWRPPRIRRIRSRVESPVDRDTLGS